MHIYSMEYVQRATNTISDALDGVTLELNGTHASGRQIKIEKSITSLRAASRFSASAAIGRIR